MRYLITPVFAALLPVTAFAECAPFSAFDSTGNYHTDIAGRVGATLTCSQWPIGFDQSRLNHAQGFVVQSLLPDQSFLAATAVAQQYFDDAIDRHARTLLQPDYDDILTDAGRQHISARSHLYQMGMLAAEVESTFAACGAVSSISQISGLVSERVARGTIRINDRAEETRQNVERQLDEGTLEQWQVYFPDVTSKDELRDLEEVRRALEPDTQPDIDSLIERSFTSLFSTTVRIDGGRAEHCLAEAFVAFPAVGAMTDTERAERYPNAQRYMDRLSSKP